MPTISVAVTRLPKSPIQIPFGCAKIAAWPEGDLIALASAYFNLPVIRGPKRGHSEAHSELSLLLGSIFQPQPLDSLEVAEIGSHQILPHPFELVLGPGYYHRTAATRKLRTGPP